MKMILYRTDAMGRMAVAVEEQELWFAVRNSEGVVSLHPLREAIVAEMNRVAEALNPLVPEPTAPEGEAQERPEEEGENAPE